jgi:hypothetical protein
MEISKPSTSLFHDIITEALITEIVIDLDSDEFEISEEQNNEDGCLLSCSVEVYHCFRGKYV